MVNFFNKYFKISLLIIIIVFFLSWIAYNDILLNQVFFILILLITFVLAIYKLEYGVYACFLELVIGSKGYLLSLPIAGLNVSLRLGIFLTVFLVYIYYVIKLKKILFFKNAYWRYYLALLVVILLAVLSGYFHQNNIKDIFLDANGFLFLGLFLPITQCMNSKERFNELVSVLFAGITWLGFSTVALFIFSE